MHEMSLTEGVVRILEDQAVKHGVSRIKMVWLEIGELSSVDPDSMLFCFGAIAKGTPLTAEAVLKIVRVPGTAWCMDCSESMAIGQRFDPCPKCGGHHLTVTAGDEMRIKELEVE